jgi:hypothetical protein
MPLSAYSSDDRSSCFELLESVDYLIGRDVSGSRPTTQECSRSPYRKTGGHPPRFFAAINGARRARHFLRQRRFWGYCRVSRAETEGRPFDSLIYLGLAENEAATRQLPA